MKHLKCPNPNDKQENITHFCYCCGIMLFDPYHKHEKNGILHFPDGLFHDCRRINEATNNKDKQTKQLNQLIDKSNQQLQKINASQIDPNKQNCLLQ